MRNSDTGPSRFRFSVGSLLVSIAVIAGFLGLMRLKFQLINSDRFMQRLWNAVETLPLSPDSLFFTSQIAGLAVAVIASFICRRSGLVWLYVAGHLVWFAALLFCVLTDYLLSHPWIVNTALVILFFEPAFTAVVALTAWCIGWTSRDVRQVLILTVLLILSLLSELLAQIAWDGFRGAIGAALAISSR